MNQSVISRMNLVIRAEMPTKDIILKRVQNTADFKDKNLLEKMYRVFNNLCEKAKESQIDDGSIGYREFLSWVFSTKITNDVYKSALLTIISSSSSDIENREELICSCLDPIFG